MEWLINAICVSNDIFSKFRTSIHHETGMPVRNASNYTDKTCKIKYVRCKDFVRIPIFWRVLKIDLKKYSQNTLTVGIAEVLF